MPQALKTLSLIQFWGWVNSLFPLLALWGNKNWPPSMKVKKLEIFQDKSGSTGCKGSSLNAPATKNPLSHPILRLEEFPFSHIVIFRPWWMCQDFFSPVLILTFLLYPHAKTSSVSSPKNVLSNLKSVKSTHYAYLM